MSHRAGKCDVAYGHYCLLYKAKENQQLPTVPTLTQAHIEPDCLCKMNVYFAEQRFFGSIHSFGGYEDHPTIVNFS
ncbi:hypothetical protein MTO96_042713 [Rhipicephalus appendiculatus]